MPLSARAGDKIEFTPPGASLEAPHAVREEKEPLKDDRTSKQISNPLPDEDVPADSESLIIVSPKKRGADASYSSTDNLDNDPNANNSSDNLNPRQQRPFTFNSATDRWDMQRGQNLDDKRMFFGRRDDDAANGHESLRTRLEAMHTAAGRTEYQKEKDDRYGRNSQDINDDSPWARRSSHQGLFNLNGMHDGQFVPLYEDIAAVNPPPALEISPTRPFTALDEQVREATLPPGMALYNAQLDTLRGKIPDETAGASQTFRPMEARTVNQSSDPFERQQPPASPPGQVQSRPAILPFPKKPGDVLW
jgi:hypothetical protein